VPRAACSRLLAFTELSAWLWLAPGKSARQVEASTHMDGYRVNQELSIADQRGQMCLGKRSSLRDRDVCTHRMLRCDGCVAREGVLQSPSFRAGKISPRMRFQAEPQFHSRFR